MASSKDISRRRKCRTSRGRGWSVSRSTVSVSSSSSPTGRGRCPWPLMFELLEHAQLGPRVAVLDYLVALGTHSPMTDQQLSRLVGRTVVDGRRRRTAESSTTGGTTRPRSRRSARSRRIRDRGAQPGPTKQDVPVALNRLVVDYDHVLICGPVFPHEVVGFRRHEVSFSGIAASEIIHFTHWLGALITSSDVLGTIDTPVRAVINRAAALLADAALAPRARRHLRRRGGRLLW